MEENKKNKDFQPYCIGEDSDVTQEAEIIQSDSISESEKDFMGSDDVDNIIEVFYESKKEYDSQWDPEWEDECYHKVLELDDICCVYGPPDDIVELDDDLFDTETETIDKISFVYGSPSEIIHHKHK